MKTYLRITKITAVLFACAYISPAFGQARKIGKYSFAGYPATVYKGQKAKINFSSSKTAKIYKTVLQEAYKTTKINFGGHYVAAFWGCGMGCSQGVLVDAMTGKVYDVPSIIDGESDETSNGCGPIEGFVFYSDSKLFIGTGCIATESNDGKHETQKKYRYAYVWNEETKRFQKLKMFVEVSVVKVEE